MQTRASAGLSRLLSTPAFRHTLVYYSLFICLGLDAAVLGPTLPSLAGQTGSPIAVMGSLFFAGSIGYVSGTLLGGRLFDRVRGHPVLGAAQLSFAALLLLVPLIPSLPILFVIMALKGVAGGVINTGANTLLVWTHREKVGPYMNGLHFFFGLGAFLAPLIAAQFLAVPGAYARIFWILGGVAIVAGLAMIFLPGSPEPGHPEAKESTPAIIAPLPVAIILTAAIFLFFYVGAEISFGGWIYTYATELGIASITTAAYLTSLFWLAFTVGRLLSVFLALRLQPERILTIALAGSLAVLALLALLQGSAPVLWIATAGLGFFFAPIWPTGFTLAGQSMRLTARASSFVLLGDSFGGMVLPFLVGFVIAAAGPRAMIPLVLASLIANGLAFLVLLRLRRNQSHLPVQPA